MDVFSIYFKQKNRLENIMYIILFMHVAVFFIVIIYKYLTMKIVMHMYVLISVQLHLIYISRSMILYVPVYIHFLQGVPSFRFRQECVACRSHLWKPIQSHLSKESLVDRGHLKVYNFRASTIAMHCGTKYT